MKILILDRGFWIEEGAFPIQNPQSKIQNRVLESQMRLVGSGADIPPLPSTANRG